MAGWFVIEKGSSGQFHFNLKAGNGETILTSENYTAKSSAENGIKSVQTNCTNDARYEKATSTNNKFYFRLKAANGEQIGKSELYESSSGRDNGIESVKTNGTTTTIKDNT